MREEKMAKRSIGSLMRKKLSDITNSQPQPKLPTVEENLLQNFPTNNDSVEQLLKERVTLLQLLEERNKIIELSGAELQRLRCNIQKLQLQNWNLAQSNSHMLAELNLGRERIKALQHEVVCKAALLKGMNLEVEGKVEMKCENKIPLLPQELEERTAQPSPTASSDGKNRNRNKGRNMRRSTGSSATSTKGTSKKKVEDKRSRLRRRHSSGRVTAHEHEALEDLFEIEDAINPVNNGEDSGLRNEGPRCSFGRPMRKAVEKVQSYKEVPLNVKMRRLA